MDCRLSPFNITISVTDKTYNMQVEQTALNASFEIFTVSYKNRVIEIRSNRPIFRNKGVKRKKFQCQVINGQPQYQSTFEKIVEEIQSYIYHLENPPFDWKDHPKNRS